MTARTSGITKKRDQLTLCKQRTVIHRLALYTFTKFPFWMPSAFAVGRKERVQGHPCPTHPLRGSIFGGNARNPTACAGKVFLAQLCDGFLELPTTLA